MSLGSKSRQDKLPDIADEYANRSTIHGISYIADRTLSLPDRLLWLVIFIVMAGLATWFVLDSYKDWQEDPVITTLHTVAKPVTELGFPAITICGAGQHMNIVEKALYQNFIKWKTSQPDDNMSLEKLFVAFLKEKFQIKEAGLSIMDILNTMVSPSNEASDAISVRKNQITCEKKAKRKKRNSNSEEMIRRKRSTIDDAMSMY